ncbi:MAG: sigma-70 family RNA polymerase sigma factor [Bacteroidales bacterium]|nr:sigma-70 family RNA polymerase sigma factor [Bacteroidales bacterium]
MTKSLSDIIRGCLDGNAEAQEVLYNTFSAKMFGLCLQYTNEYEEAKDILQEGFIRVFTNLNQYNQKGSLEGWIRRIMINTALEKYRDKHYLARVDDEIEKSEQIIEVDVVDDLSAQELMKFIHDLSPKYRMVFNLYAIEGYSHKEISVLLNISEGTSKSNLSRARTILQEKIFHHNKITNKVVS